MITKLGVIFNLDPHDKPGSHWVSMYADFDKLNEIYYFDSYGLREPKEVTALMNRLKEQSENMGNETKIHVNNIRHQFKNSECGIYSINFILKLLEGNTYVFTHPSAHPLRFSTDSGNSSAYTTGVTVNSSTQVTIVVASGAPTLYYYCSSHSGMGGTANTPVPANNNLQVTTTNQGQDNITNTQYAAFDDVLFSASGFSFSLSNGSLIATI